MLPESKGPMPLPTAPLIMGVQRDQLPPSVHMAHDTAQKDLADTYTNLTTGGMVVKLNILQCEIDTYPELNGIDTMWLMYRKAESKGVVL